MTDRETIKKTEGVIFEVQRWSLHDGEGIRSTVFMKGCSLRCQWCHNPESWRVQPEILVFSEKCTGCNNCSRICPSGAVSITNGKVQLDRSKCTMCLECVSNCEGNALALYGRNVTAGDLFESIKRDSVFYRESGGGVTFSGGEPTMQGPFLEAMVKLCIYSGIDTAIETSAYFDWNSLKETIDMTDFVFVDIKHMDEGEHKKLTGVSNRLILENIVKMSDMGKKPTIRIPLIEGVNDGENLKKTFDFISGNVDCAGVELLPYHSFGEGKYPALGLDAPYHFNAPSQQAVQEAKELIRQFGLNVIDYK